MVSFIISPFLGLSTAAMSSAQTALLELEGIALLPHSADKMDPLLRGAIDAAPPEIRPDLEAKSKGFLEALRSGHLEKDPKPKNDLANLLHRINGNGHQGIARLFRENDSWKNSREGVRDVVREILQDHLGGDPDKINADTRSFLSHRFTLRNGQTITGHEILSAFARLEKPGMTAEDAIKALGGKKKALDILKEKYLGVPVYSDEWKKSEEGVRGVAREVLDQLGGNPAQMTTYRFSKQPFVLKSGQTISGAEILSAVAMLEKPGISVADAIKALGGGKKVLEILKTKYLGVPVFSDEWKKSKEGIAGVAREILEQLGGDPERMNTDRSFLNRSFKLRSGQIISGYTLVRAMAKLETGMDVQTPIEALGGGKKVLAILKEKYLGIPVYSDEWKKTKEGIASVVREIFDRLDRKPENINSGNRFLSHSFTLRSGQAVSGREILSAVVVLERPGMNLKAATKAVGGDKKALAILKTEYLGVPVYSDEWKKSKEGIAGVAREILEQLGGDPEKMNANKSFLGRSFKLKSGQMIPGYTLVRAIAKLETSMDVNTAVKAVGGAKRVLEILKEKYLGLSWKDSKEGVREVAREVLEDHFDGDPKEITTHSLLHRSFTLKNGQTITGRGILYAIARLEKPGMTTIAALSSLGRYKGVLTVLKEKYLGLTQKDSQERMRNVAREVLDHLDGDPEKLTGGPTFLFRSFTLKSGKTITGRAFLNAIARLEKPGMTTVTARNALGGDRMVLEILKEKYLNLPQSWKKTKEGVVNVAREVFFSHLNGDPEGMNTASLHCSFSLKSGQKVTGYEILHAVALLEKPGMTVREAIKALGGRRMVLEVLKKKYLKILSWRETREGIVRVAREMLDQLGGDPDQMKTSHQFTTRHFTLKNGQTVTGYEILFALARFEKPELSTADILKALGGPKRVLEILKERYLGFQKSWKETREGITQVAKEVLDQLGGDTEKMTTAGIFLNRSFILKSGQTISGYQILSALARLEKPGLASDNAIEALGGRKKVLDILKQKYLGIKLPAPPEEVEKWLQNHQFGDILLALRNQAGPLQIVLTHLAGREISEVEIREFILTFSSLNLQTDLEHKPGLPLESAEQFLEGLFLIEERWQHLSSSEWIDLMKIYVQLLYPRFERNKEEVFAELKQKAALLKDRPQGKFFQYALDHFEQAEKFRPVGIKTTLKPYERIAAYQITHQERGLLADDPGVGKTLEFLAAAEWLKERGRVSKTIIVTPNSVKKNWVRQIQEHLSISRKVVVLDSVDKEALIQASRDADYVIVHYEFLRDKTKEALAPLLENAGLVGLDESQEMSNPKTTVQQAEAVRQLFGSIPRRWLLSATPYHTKIEHLYGALSFLYPEIFSSYQAFKQAYFRGNAGLLKLQREMSSRMIRRAKQAVLVEYKPGLEKWDIPRKVMVDPEIEGAYAVTEDQARLVQEMFRDFRGWARTKGIHTITHFTHLRFLWNAVLDPRLVGEKMPTPLYEALDKIVAKRMAEGKKVILYAEHHLVLDELQKRYQRHGLRAIDGRVERAERDLRIEEFQSNPDVKILVSGLKVGGAGISLTAADSVIYCERSLSFSVNYQSEDRPHRLDETRPAKKEIEIVRMLPKYPQEWVSALEDENERVLFEQGTVGEILEERMAGLRAAYHLVLDGLMDPRAFDKRMREFMLTGVRGLKDWEKKKSLRDSKEVVQELMPLWRQWQKTPAKRAALISLSRRGKRAQISLKPLAHAIKKIPQFSAHDMTILYALLENGNKYVVSHFLERLPAFLKQFYAQGGTLSQWNPKGEHGANRWMVPVLIASEGKNLEIWKQVMQELSETKPRQERYRLGNLLFVAAFHGFKGDLGWLADRSIPFTDRLQRLNQLGWILALDPEKYPTDFSAANVQQAYLDLFYDQFGISKSAENVAKIQALFEKWGHFDQIYGLMAGLKQDSNLYHKEIAQLKEIVGHIVAGDYREWRNSQTIARHSGDKIDYLGDEAEFWQEWSRPRKTHFKDGADNSLIVEDTDDPRLILEMGAFSPDMTNCFNYCGDPAYNHTLIDLLGSRNKRLVLASNGKVMSVAAAKVRKDEKGEPVLYLDRELYRGRDNYREEMLGHLKDKKARHLSPKPPVAAYIADETRAGDLKLFGTGSFARTEYVEAFHGVRPAVQIFHRARPY